MRPLDQAVFDRLNAEGRWGDREPPVFGSGGISSTKIDAIEKAIGFPTPPDFRRLLENLRDPGGVLFPWGGFDLRRYRDTIDAVLRGILLDVEHSLWLVRWGERPEEPSEREKRVREDFKTWPKLLPIRGHRCLVADPCEAGNPVFSIAQSDIIYCGSDLASFLLREFIGGGRQDISDHSEGAVRSIPVWSDFAERTAGFQVEKPEETTGAQIELLRRREQFKPRDWPSWDDD